MAATIFLGHEAVDERLGTKRFDQRAVRGDKDHDYHGVERAILYEVALELNERQEPAEREHAQLLDLLV